MPATGSRSRWARSARQPPASSVAPSCARARHRPAWKMGTFLISPGSGQKGTDLLQVCPLLLGNEECPHFPRPPDAIRKRSDGARRLAVAAGVDALRECLVAAPLAEID